MKRIILATILSLVFGTATLAQKPTKADPKPVNADKTQPVPAGKATQAEVDKWKEGFQEWAALNRTINRMMAEHGITELQKERDDLGSRLLTSVPLGYHVDRNNTVMPLVEDTPPKVDDKAPHDVSKSVPAPKK